MRRWGWNFLVGVALVIFAATLIFWMRSYGRGDWMGWFAQSVENEVERTTSVGAGSAKGQLWIAFAGHRVTPLEGQILPAQPVRSSGWFWVTRPSISSGVPPEQHLLGFAWVGYRNRPLWRGVKTNFTLVLPHWFVVLLSAIFPAWHFLGYQRRLRRWREQHNLCPECGYDLRASPGRCPECGSVVTAYA